MKFTFFLIIWFWIVPVLGSDFYELPQGEQPDHLVPFWYGYIIKPYTDKIAEKLLVTRGEYGRYIVRPSFGKSSSVSLHKTFLDDANHQYAAEWLIPRDKIKYFVTLTTPSEKIGCSGKSFRDPTYVCDVRVERTDREVSERFAAAVQRVWGKVLQGTRYPETATGGFDGVNYQFSVEVRGSSGMYGQTHSPQGPFMQEFVSLGEALEAFAKDETITEEELIEKLGAFEQRIP